MLRWRSRVLTRAQALVTAMFGASIAYMVAGITASSYGYRILDGVTFMLASVRFFVI